MSSHSSSLPGSLLLAGGLHPGSLHVITWYDDRPSDPDATYPDPAWEYTDAAGHWHSWDQLGSVDATLILSTTPVSRSALHCRLCGEVVEPRRTSITTARRFPRTIDWRITAEVPFLRLAGMDPTQCFVARFFTEKQQHWGIVTLGASGWRSDITSPAEARAQMELRGIGRLAVKSR